MDALLGLAPLESWYDRIAAFGHGTATPMSAEDALKVARGAKPAPVTHLSPNGDPGGLRAGSTVIVTPDDNARVPVKGTLVAASASQIVINRNDGQGGDLHVHFPRIGFDVIAA